MEKEVISSKQAVNIMVMFLIGGSLVLSQPSKAGRDVWLSVLITGIMSVPFYFVYSRIIRLFPRKNFFEILQLLFGRIAGTIVNFLFILFAVYISSLVLRDFTEFMQTTVLPETPQYIFRICMILCCIYLAKMGIEVMGRWSMFILPILIGTVLLTIVLSLKHMDIDYMKPFLRTPLPKLAQSAYSLFAFPFGEVCVFLMLFDSLKDKRKSYKIFYISLGIGIFLLLLVFVRNLLVLGMGNLEKLTFPSYSAVRVIDVGNFAQRIEEIVAIVFLICGMLKITVCLLAASKSTAQMLNFPDSRFAIAPIGLFILLLSALVYNDVMEMHEFLTIWNYVAVPFQIVFPLLMWITAEIRMRKMNKSSRAKEFSIAFHSTRTFQKESNS